MDPLLINPMRFSCVDFEVTSGNDLNVSKSEVRDEGNILGSYKELRVISTLLKASTNGGYFEFESGDTCVLTCLNPITFGWGRGHKFQGAIDGE